MSKNHQQTTKQKQIEFMWHLYKESFTVREIAKIYDITKHQVIHALNRRIKV